MLRRIAASIHTTARAGAVAVRWGGEDFLIEVATDQGAGAQRAT